MLELRVQTCFTKEAFLHFYFLSAGSPQSSHVKSHPAVY